MIVRELGRTKLGSAIRGESARSGVAPQNHRTTITIIMITIILLLLVLRILMIILMMIMMMMMIVIMIIMITPSPRNS